MMQQEENALRQQLSMYTDKYDEFQQVLFLFVSLVTIYLAI